VLKKELIGHLRAKRRIRRSQHSGVAGQSRVQIVDALSIRERPAEIEDCAIPGHWEVISLPAQRTVTLRPWWNGIRVSPHWYRCPAKTLLRPLYICSAQHRRQNKTYQAAKPQVIFGYAQNAVDR
jgi:hypothetical protein